MNLFKSILVWNKTQIHHLNAYYVHLLELNNIEKSRVISSFLFFFHLSFLGLLYLQHSQPIINPSALPWAYLIQITSIACSGLLFLISKHIKSNVKTDFYFPIICLGLYSGSLMCIGIFTGMMTILTGVFTIGSIYSGLLIFSGRIIFWGSVPCFIVFYGISFLNLFDILPYAFLFHPYTLVPEESQNFMILSNMGITTFVTIVISQIFVAFLERWSVRDQTQRHLMSIDPLTQTLNRRGLNQKLDELLHSEHLTHQSIAFILLDIDYFKNINDQFGHDAGDRVLQVIPQVLRQHLRDYDIMGRYGGEEFLLIFTDTPLISIQHILERCRHAIEDNKLEYQGKLIQFTASFGVYFSHNSQQHGAHTLFQLADQALYQAKNLGRNRVQIIEDRHEQQSTQAMI